MSATRVVIVGGGYGGVNLAKALDEDFDVVLVDRKEAFSHNVAALRGLVDPTWLPNLFFPYASLLERGEFVQGRAVEVEPGRVTLESGRVIEADYVVIATGSTYPFPAKVDTIGIADTHARYEAAHVALAAADRVMLLGAGPVGLELAGEIAAVWPDKHITLVDAADDVLSGPFKQELRDELRRQLDALGVEVVLGSPLAVLPATEPGELGAFTVETTDGRTVTADLWYKAFGVTPVTDHLTGDLHAARRDDGFIETGPTLQVAGHQNVFALGDASSIDTNMAGRAGRQAQLVAANIRALEAGTTLEQYEPLPPVILIPLGPTGGAGQLPGSDEIAGADVASQLKGTHMMVDNYAALFGITPTTVGGE
jgi:NADH dehydrogenase FAD-containing subunit